MEKKESRILIDTDVVINLLDNKRSFHLQVKRNLAFFQEKNVNPSISLVTVIEILQGNKSIADKKQLSKDLMFFNQFDITVSIGNIAKELILKYSSSHGLMLVDALIAATSLQLEIPLYSLNKKDYKFIDTLKLYEPK
jgi:predicted nucleic acid-binding protein